MVYEEVFLNVFQQPQFPILMYFSSKILLNASMIFLLRKTNIWPSGLQSKLTLHSLRPFIAFQT